MSRLDALLGVPTLVAERHRFLDTIESLTDAEFETGRTLCAGWAPRDVLAHLVGTADVTRYVRHGLRVNAVNAMVVADAQRMSRGEITARGRVWADEPGAGDRAAARFLIGDVSVHHQDVLRGLGRTRDLPVEIAGAIFREGIVLSTGTRRNLLRHRVVPTTAGGRAVGRGRVVRGSTEALGLWLAGRRGLEDELEFAG